MRTSPIVSFLLLAFVSLNLYADVPNQVTYQGKLKEYGIPVTGTRTMSFEIYDAEVNGTQVWSSGDVTVVVSSGTFSYNLAPQVDWRGKDFWIQTTVSSKRLSPREKITSQFYALHARTAEDIAKPAGKQINFSVGSNPSVTISETGEMKNLVGGATYYMVPRGAIIMWSGLVTSIPQGWALCDGTNGTPDLRDRFILGVSAGENPGATGGAHSKALTVEQMPAHSHSASSGNQSADHTHSGATSTNGDHSHTYNNRTEIQNADGGLVGFWVHNGESTTSTNGAHSHSFTTGGVSANHTHQVTINNTGSNQSIDFRPAYYKLAFLLRL